MRKILSLSAFFSVAAVLVIVVGVLWDSSGQRYVSDMFSDPQRYMDKGAYPLRDEFDPRLAGYDLETMNHAYDYDFDKLDAVFKKLEGVDRRGTLKRLFDAVTEGAVSNTEKHLCILLFLQRASLHNSDWQPVHRDKSLVTDPLVLLNLAEMRCGHIARLAVDLIESAGFEGRLVQLAGHVIAEINYDGEWHYFDADGFGGGQSAIIDGKVPSLAVLAEHREALDRLVPNLEMGNGGSVRTISSRCLSAVYFNEANYTSYKPMYYRKTGDTGDKYYGWQSLETIHDVDFKLSAFEPKWKPGAPVITQVGIHGGSATVSWEASADRDDDLIGYTVYIGSRSRGWGYVLKPVADGVLPYAQQTWEADKYDLPYLIPPGDITVMRVEATEITFPLRETGQFVTVVPRDAYGEEIGRPLAQPSEEIFIPSLLRKGRKEERPHGGD